MFGPKDFLLGGLLPIGVAIAALALGWLASRRAAVAWPLGVLAGYLGGTIAVEAGGVGISAALQKLKEPHDAQQWTPLLALVAIVPAIAAALLGKRRGLRWLLIAPLAALAPLWLLWGGKYLPNAEIRASGFAKDAWEVGEAALIIGAVGVALLAVWRLWELVEPTEAPRTRSLLAAIVLTGTAATAGLTGSFVYAQAIGVLAASVGGCFVAMWALRVGAGPEAAAGPIVTLAGCLLLLAACYSSLQPLQACGLWAAIALSAGWLPSVARLNDRGRIALRAGACLIPLALVLFDAASEFAAKQRQQQEAAASNPYLNM